jgi:5-(carboxyamino)imidazole ribonucleotide synthase
MAGLPLPQPRQHSPALMLNLLGDIWFDAQGRQRTPDWASILAQPGTHLHLYGKTEARRGRKMGHLTITGANLATVQSEALICARHLDLPVRAELEAMT